MYFLSCVEIKTIIIIIIIIYYYNNIGRTGIWRWVDTVTVFQGENLPILSITTSP